MKKALLSLSIFTLAACGGSGGDNGEKIDKIFGGSSDISNIAGVWDETENMGDEGIDEGYLVIDKNGVIAFYDYMGDSYDQEGNCYWINIGQLKSVGNNNFEYTRVGETASEKPNVLTIIRKDDKLIIDFNDPEDPDEDTLTLTKSNKSENNFTPECADSRNASTPYKVDSKMNMLLRPE